MRTKFMVVLLALFMVPVFPAVLAQGISADDGNELFREFQSSQAFASGNLQGRTPSNVALDYGSYTGYVWGVFETLAFYNAICPETHVKGEQVFDVVSNYLKSHPETRNHQQLELVSAALKQAFPCR